MATSVTVRPYLPADKEAIRRVCAETAPSFSEKRRPVLLNLYCDYYIEQEPQNCFVLDDGGAAVGYILTAADWTQYRLRFTESYLPSLRKLSLPFYLFKRRELRHSRFTDDYPAHLHIDITESYQHSGYGRVLMDVALDNLRGQGVRGIQLGVAARNTGAVRFYEKYGFRRLHATRFEITFGLPLSR